MNFEKTNKYNNESLGPINPEENEEDGESTMLIQEQEPWEPFDEKYIGEDSKRLSASPEQIEIMDQRLKDLSVLFNGFDKWHLDGALNISLLKEEYIGNHKDVDLSVERNDLKDLEIFLEKKGYGLFLSQNEKDDNKIDDDNRKKVMRRVSHVGMENYAGHPMICALGEKGKIDDSKSLNYVDLHIIDRDANNSPLLTSGVNCPEEWTKSYPVVKEGKKINLSHPAKVLYYKLNQGRNYDSTDIDQLLELDAVKQSDIDEIKSIYEKEFIKKRESIFSLCDKITQKIHPGMQGEEIFKEIKELEEFKDKDKIDESLKLFSNEISKLLDKSPKSVSNLAINMFNIEGKNQEKIAGLERMRQVVGDREGLKKIRNEIKM
ncbi:MAG: hypothetical protein EOM88_00210 [Clostridia bacterium]|nr:hypothetical protein [Clostridia bacterium]